MKSAFYYLTAVLMLCSSAFAAPSVRAATSNSGVRVPAQSAITTAEGQLIVGHWEGTLTYRGSEQGISVDISSVGDAYSGTADIPDVGIINIPLRNLAFERSVIQFDLPLGRGRYVGKLQKDTIIGNTGNRWDDEFVVTIVFERKQRPAFPYRQKELRFSNGDVTLVGTLFLPRSPGPHPAVVAVHGATERTRDNPDYRFLADLLPRHGIAVLLYDGRGAGESTGNFNSASFVDLAQDAIAGVQELSRYPEIDAKHIGLWGISQGGWVVPQAAVLSKDIAFLIVVSGMASTAATQMDYLTTVSLRKFGFSDQAVNEMLKVRHVVDNYYRGQISVEEARKAVVAVHEEPWFPIAFIPSKLPTDISHDKWRFEMDFDPLPLWTQITLPTLILYGDSDEQVPASKEASRFEQALEAAHNQDFTILGFPNTSHEMLTVPQKGAPWHWRYISSAYRKTMAEWILKRTGH